MRLLAFLLLLVGMIQPLLAEDFASERKRAEGLLGDGKTEEYVKIIDRLSRQGDPRAQSWYGYFLQRRGKTAEAEKWLLLSAQAGDTQGQFRLGALYFLMSPQRPVEAKKWLKIAAAQGNGRASFILGLLDSPSLEPKVIDGQAKVVELADIQYLTMKAMFSSLDGLLSCYKVAVDELDSIFGPAAKRCKDISVQEYGNTIPISGYYEFSTDYGGCVRTLVLKARGISNQELVDCSRRIP